MRYFVAVAEELHFGRAAERLYISQPSLSAQISSLEDELGARLLHRNTRQVRLTEAGEVFLAEARRTLQQGERAVSETRRAARGEVGRLSVGFVSPAPLGILSSVLGAFRARSPEVELELHEMNTTVQLRALREGRIHVGVLRGPIGEVDGPLEVKSAMQEEMIAGLPESHSLSSSRWVSLASLAEEPLVIVSRDLEPYFYEQIMCLFHGEGLSPRVAQEVGQLPISLSLISEGVGVGLGPASVQKVNRMGVVYRRIEDQTPPVDTSLAWRRDDQSPVLRAFLEMFAEVSRQKGHKN